MGGHAGCTERHACLTDEHVREAGEYLQHCQGRYDDGIILVKIDDIDDEVSTVGGDTDIITGAITTPTPVPLCIRPWATPVRRIRRKPSQPVLAKNFGASSPFTLLLYPCAA